MRRTARRRFVRHVCLRNLFLPFLFGNFKLPLDTGSRFLRAAARSTSCIMVASCPFLRCIFRKRPVQCREARGLVTELWSPRFVTIQWLCSQLCYVTAANQWTLVETELLATPGWKCGCQHFSCRCLHNATHCRKKICWKCWFQESIPAFPFWNSKLPLHTRSLRFLRAAVRSTISALNFGCIMPIPSLQQQKKHLSYAEKQSVWSRSCGLQDLLQYSDCSLSFAT